MASPIKAARTGTSAYADYSADEGSDGGETDDGAIRSDDDGRDVVEVRSDDGQEDREHPAGKSSENVE